ncbi:unnamed protein product [Notodromas monacha]|uniref:Uncharacterized protein n=1 Tax=Notodromas monacha TaxID=399045 RepID=A0A7R9BML5_9CRUS|nr:unnamed protein product [Notodromas monacha]CAG0917986.1 unnamed protein product [Notodromas monacha]
MSHKRDQESDSDWDSMSEAPPVPKERKERAHSSENVQSNIPPGDFREAVSESGPEKAEEKPPKFKFSFRKKYEPQGNDGKIPREKIARSSSHPEEIPEEAPLKRELPPHKLPPLFPVTSSKPIVHESSLKNQSTSALEYSKNPGKESSSNSVRFHTKVESVFELIRVFLTSVVHVFLGIGKVVIGGILSPLVFGVFILVGEYVWIPALRVLKESFFGPLAFFLADVAGFVRDASDPLWQGLGNLFQSIALVVRAFRLVEVNQVSSVSSRRLHEV